MTRQFWFALCTGALLLVASPGRAWAAPIGELLVRADRIRSSDRQGFDALLAEARAQRASATPSERDLLDLLISYQAALEGRYGLALRESSRLAGHARSVDLRYRAALLVANTAAITRDYTTGLDYLTRAANLEKQVASPALRVHGAVVAGTLYNQLGQPRRALEYADRVLERPTSLRDACFGHENRTRALAELGQGSARDFAHAIDVCDRAGERLVASLARGNLARSLASQGRHRESIDLVRSTLPEARRSGYARLMGELYGVLAESHLALGDSAEATRAARAILRIEGQHPHWTPLIVAQRVLASAAERNGDHATALVHYRAYHTAQQARLDEVTAREYAYFSTRMDALRKERQAATLRYQNAALLLQQRVAAERARTLRLMVVLLGLAIGVIGYWAWQYRRTHHKLLRLSRTDSLTGVDTRGHFAVEARNIIASCAGRRRPVSMLLLDVDHFKQVNDQCGHAVGDWVLRQVARACQAACPPGARVGRIGGEEFAMVIEGATAAGAKAIAERLRAGIRAIDGFAGGCHLPVTTSVGVACNACAGYDYEALLAKADAAMYAAKHAGRDRVWPGELLDECA